MTYEVYNYIFIASIILCLLTLGLTIFLFFFLRIPEVIGNLTGSRARKEIQSIDNKNRGVVDSYSKKIKQSSGVFITDKIITEQITPNKEKKGRKTPEEQPVEETTVLGDCDETVVLYDSVLQETTVLSDDIDVGKTADLNESSNCPAKKELFQHGGVFTIEYDITYVHTHEKIV